MKKMELDASAAKQKNVRRSRSNRRNSPEKIDGKRRKNKRESRRTWDDDRRYKSNATFTYTSSRLEEGHDRRKMKTRNGKKMLRVICPVNFHFETAIGYRTYCLMHFLPKQDGKVSENVTKMTERITT